MAKKKPSALDALARLNEERRSLEQREAQLKRAAALELGMVVIDAGGAVIAPMHLKTLIARIVAIGVEPAIERLADKDEPATAVSTKKSGAGGAGEVRHD